MSSNEREWVTNDMTTTKDLLETEQSKQQLAKVALRIKELEHELTILEDGLSSVILKAKWLALLTTIFSHG